MRRFLAVVMAAVLLVTACPAGVVNAAEKQAAQSNRVLKTKVTNLKVKATVENGSYELKYSWKTVKGAQYQYRYKTADDAKYTAKKTVKSAKKSITFLSYGNVTFQVRAVKTIKGKKQYSAWTTKKLTSAKIDGMFTKAMGLEKGQIKDGVIFMWGLYADDKDNPNCDLMICNFLTGPVMTGDIVYIIFKDGKIDYYGDCERDTLELSGDRYGVTIKVPGQGDDHPEYTLGYCQNASDKDGVLINEEGKEILAKGVDMDEAWEMYNVTLYGKPVPDIDVAINDEGKPVMHFSWPSMKRAVEYEVRYTLDYDEKLYGGEPQQYETATTKATYFDIEIPEKHGNIALAVAVKTAQGIREFSSYSWWNGELIDANAEIEMHIYKIRKALMDKAKELAANEEEKTLPIEYALYDVEQSGIPLLFYARAYNRLQVEVYRYDYEKEAVVLAKTTTGKTTLDGVSALYASDGEFIACTSDSAYAGSITAYKLTNAGKLKVTSDYRYDYDKKKFTKDGKTIKQSTFEKYQEAVWKCTQIELTELKRDEE